MLGPTSKPPQAETEKDLLRFIACGSVDDGKSTLIGRFLYDSKLLFEDELSSLTNRSSRHGTTERAIDFALLVDGLEAEREQGITIDVAYRFFSTARRSFIAIDAPGHEQYTRNMATGASRADLAIILVDARKGILVQTLRHSFICSLLGIRQVILAVNKIDLVGYDKKVFDSIVSDYTSAAARLAFTSVISIPISARDGDNIVERLGRVPWYCGPVLLELLEKADVGGDAVRKPFRLPIQWVNRPNPDFRGYAGTIASGRIKCNDPVIVAGSGPGARIKQILTFEGPQATAAAGDAITVTLTEELDLARGDLLVGPENQPTVAEQFAAHLIWLSGDALLAGRSYLARIGTKMVPITVSTIKYKINVNTGEHLAASSLGLNDIAFCNFATGAPVAFDPYDQNRHTGAFIMIDRFTNQTVGAGMIAFALRRGLNIQWQPLTITKQARAASKRQKPMIVWFTGLSGAGKSTIADAVERRLHAAGQHTMLLDGDNVRHGLNRDLGFTEADRVENIRRAGEVARLMVDAGLIVLCCFISPYRAERDLVRGLVAEDEFLEVFVDTPIEECARRDPKGLYAKAVAGQIKNFTGFDAPYDVPENPEVHLHTVGHTLDHLADMVIAILADRGIAAI
jgi:bifunctional enzyme CysN/CysC